MSIMFRNSNAALEKELAVEDYRAHPVRNWLAILAVALTALLIVLTFTIGIGFARTVTRSMGAAPGPGADGAGIYGDEEVLERVRNLPQVDWAAYVKRCSSTRLHNKEFYALDVYLLAADEVHYDKNMVDLIVGKYPEKADEILLSDTMSERLGLDQQTGITYTLKVVIQGDDESIEQEFPMTVCGYYNNPLKNCADIYEEIYTDAAFIDACNPNLPEGYDKIYVKLNNLNPLMFGHDQDEKLMEVNEMAGGNGREYKMSDMTLLIIIPLGMIILCIMLCGYFFIYNIFDISIVNNIRFYGELKTIGMTSRQLRRMLLWQMNRIALFGILAGGMVGCVVGRAVSGKIVPMFADGIAMFYQPAGILSSFLFGMVFAWVTLLISTMKPFRAACTVSPVEAARYRAKRKKGVFSVISFALSGILFLVVYTIAMGFSVEIQVQRHILTDYQIRHKGILWIQNEPFMDISQDLLTKLQDLDFVEDFRTYYIARTVSEYVFAGVPYYSASAEIAPEGELAKDRLAYGEKQFRETGSRGFEINERGNLPVGVAGVNPDCLLVEAPRYTVLEGSLDEEKFAKGDQLIYQRSILEGDMNQSEGMEYQIHAGDKVNVSFYDDAVQRYVDRQYTVLAIIADTDPYGVSSLNGQNIWLNEDDFRGIYSDYENLVGAVTFNTTDGGALSDQEKQEAVERILEEEGNVQLLLDSVYQHRVYYMEMKRLITLFGMMLSVIVGVIGIVNMINTVTTDVMARKVEYAAMQSIGMTGRQMQRDIFRKYAFYTFTALGFATVIGGILSYMVGSDLAFNFSAGAFVQALAIFLAFSILLCVIMARTLTRVMNKRSIVERLREVV